MSSGPALESLVTKDEDPTGLLNEGFRYRDLETGTFITRDPLGFVDGPNIYAYVSQNPWTKFDPQGLTGSYLPGGMASASFQYGLNTSQAQLARQSDQAQGSGFMMGAELAFAGGLAKGAIEMGLNQAGVPTDLKDIPDLLKGGWKALKNLKNKFAKNAENPGSDAIDNIPGDGTKTQAQNGNTPGEQKAEAQTQTAADANSQTDVQTPPSASQQTTVLGNGQDTRVIPWAEKTDGRTLDNGMTKEQFEALPPKMQNKVNDGQLRKHINEGDNFVDIGPDGNKRSLDLRKSERLRLDDRNVPVKEIPKEEVDKVLNE